MYIPITGMTHSNKMKMIRKMSDSGVRRYLMSVEMAESPYNFKKYYLFPEIDNRYIQSSGNAK